MNDEIWSPPTPPSLSSPKDESKPLSTQPAQMKLWDHAGKLKNPDTVATFSKVSTNWHAREMNAWGSHQGNSTIRHHNQCLIQVFLRVLPQNCCLSRVAGQMLAVHDLLQRVQLRSSFSNSEVESPPRPVFHSRESFLPQPQ